MSNKYLLNTMDISGAYQPSFYDVQSYLNFLLSDQLELGVLGYYSKNDFKMIPEDQETRFGGIQQVLNFRVYFLFSQVSTYHLSKHLSIQFRTHLRFKCTFK